MLVRLSRLRELRRSEIFRHASQIFESELSFWRTRPTKRPWGTVVQMQDMASDEPNGRAMAWGKISARGPLANGHDRALR
jgi:hypothetical protein